MSYKRKISFFKVLKYIFHTNFFNHARLSRIEKVDEENKAFVIYTRGIYKPLYIKYIDIINDFEFVASFSSKHASILGYYYGLYYLSNKNNDISTKDWFNLGINEKTFFLIHGIDRKGNLLYVQHDNQTIKSSSPLEIMRDNNFIDKFSPLQSCYIGILAGINEAKEKSNENKLSSKQLKLV
ncbi:hypothetical protein ACD661_16170 [Legionella lytica]|uniref:Uncharacterized protein n=1 Tax=Legionella lytica TaxID=96232 RepID=A0ABW8DBJ9_9GAMM